MARANEGLLSAPALIGVRKVTCSLTDATEAAWRDLVQSRPEEREPGGEAAEALHDFRVALRTLRSWLRANEDLFETDKAVRRRLKRAADATGPGRDAQVLLKWLNGTPMPSRRAMAAARLWSEQLQARAAAGDVIAKLDDLDKTLRQLRKDAQVVHWKARIDEPPWWERPLAAELARRLRAERDVLIRRLDGFIELRLRYDQGLDEPAMEAGHDVRIAGKRVRYLIEPIAGELETAAGALKRLKTVQTVLGDLHDIHVALTELEPFATEQTQLEAQERGREALAAAQEARPVRRMVSSLSGFAALAGTLRENERRLLDEFDRVSSADNRAELAERIDACVAELDHVANGDDAPPPS